MLTDRKDQTKAENIVDVIENISFDPANIQEVVGNFSKTDTVVIKSLTGLLQLFSTVSVARWLQQLSAGVTGVVAVVHSDGVDDEVVVKLSKLASSFITIQPYRGEKNLCSIIHRYLINTT